MAVVKKEVVVTKDCYTCDFTGEELPGTKNFGITLIPGHLPANCGLPRTKVDIDESEHYSFQAGNEKVRYHASKVAQEAYARLMKFGLRVNFGHPEDLSAGLNRLNAVLDSFDDGEKADELWEIISR